MGMRDLTHGLMEGVKGILVDPIRGAQDEGVAGLVKGTRKGLMSALVKPTVGAIDFIARTAQGARNSASDSGESHRTRTRAPRYFGSDKVLLPFDHEKSHWQNDILYWLEQVRFHFFWLIVLMCYCRVSIERNFTLHVTR